MRVSFLALTLCVQLLAIIPVNAQGSNPPEAPCGLPAGGIIRADAIYTLIDDCTQTSKLDVQPNVTLTINGEGHTVTASSDSNAFVETTRTSTVELDQITVDGGGQEVASLIKGRGSFTKVTFRNLGEGAALSTGSATLNNVLFEYNNGGGYNKTGNGSALNIPAGGSVEITDAVFRANDINGGAIVAHGTATLTTKGCLTLSGNTPYDVVASNWTKEHTGACADTIGNGDKAVIPAPGTLPCGLPEAGNIDRSATYSLRYNCNLGVPGRNQVLWRISENVNITINGNGFRIIGGSGSNYSRIYTAATSRLTIKNVVMEHFYLLVFGRLVVDSSKFRNTPFITFHIQGNARFNNIIMEKSTTSEQLARFGATFLVGDQYRDGAVTISNAIIRDNTSLGGASALWTWRSYDLASIRLEDCITFSNNVPSDYSGEVIDNSVGACPDTIGPGPPTAPPGGPPPAAPGAPDDRPTEPPVDSDPPDCSLRLGAIGLICRYPGEPPTMCVLEISPDSVGTTVFCVNQPEVEAEDGIIASALCGRVTLRSERDVMPHLREILLTNPKYEAILQVPRRYITVSMGPNYEGKVHNTIISQTLWGEILGRVDTFTGPPGPPCPPPEPTQPEVVEEEPVKIPYAARVQRQPTGPDGCVRHIVQPGDTVYTIGVAYRIQPIFIVLYNQLPDGGRFITPGQELLVTDRGCSVSIPGTRGMAGAAGGT